MATIEAMDLGCVWDDDDDADEAEAVPLVRFDLREGWQVETLADAYDWLQLWILPAEKAEDMATSHYLSLELRDAEAAVMCGDTGACRSLACRPRAG